MQATIEGGGCRYRRISTATDAARTLHPSPSIIALAHPLLRSRRR